MLCSQLLDLDSFYLVQDPLFLNDIFRSNVSYLANNWRSVGRPVYVVPISAWMFGMLWRRHRCTAPSSGGWWWRCEDSAGSIASCSFTCCHVCLPIPGGVLVNGNGIITTVWSCCVSGEILHKPYCHINSDLHRICHDLAGNASIVRASSWVRFWSWFLCTLVTSSIIMKQSMYKYLIILESFSVERWPCIAFHVQSHVANVFHCALISATCCTEVMRWFRSFWLHA